MGVLYPLVDAVQEARVKGREIVTVRKGCGWNASLCVYVCVCGRERHVGYVEAQHYTDWDMSCRYALGSVFGHASVDAPVHDPLDLRAC